MTYGALITGHASREVVEAVQNAVEKGSIYGQPTEAEVELAETISSLVPSMQMVRLVNSGTEATMHALRLARGFTGRKKILKFDGGFHGSHDSVLVKPGPHGSIAGRPSSEGVPLTFRRILLWPLTTTRKPPRRSFELTQASLQLLSWSLSLGTWVPSLPPKDSSTRSTS